MILHSNPFELPLYKGLDIGFWQNYNRVTLTY
jgi:hypothetical protein